MDSEGFAFKHVFLHNIIAGAEGVPFVSVDLAEEQKLLSNFHGAHLMEVEENPAGGSQAKFYLCRPLRSRTIARPRNAVVIFELAPPVDRSRASVTSRYADAILTGADTSKLPHSAAEREEASGRTRCLVPHATKIEHERRRHAKLKVDPQAGDLVVSASHSQYSRRMAQPYAWGRTQPSPHESRRDSFTPRV